MTHIGPSIQVIGDVSSDGDLTIHGRISGQIVVREGSAVIASDARVHADVRGDRVVVHGEVQGAITATERIELGPSSTVAGNLSARHVVIADGARFDGHVDMGQRTIAARLASYKAAHA